MQHGRRTGRHGHGGPPSYGRSHRPTGAVSCHALPCLAMLCRAMLLYFITSPCWSLFERSPVQNNQYQVQQYVNTILVQRCTIKHNSVCLSINPLGRSPSKLGLFGKVGILKGESKATVARRRMVSELEVWLPILSLIKL